MTPKTSRSAIRWAALGLVLTSVVHADPPAPAKEPVAAPAPAPKAKGPEAKSAPGPKDSPAPVGAPSAAVSAKPPGTPQEAIEAYRKAQKALRDAERLEAESRKAAPAAPGQAESPEAQESRKTAREARRAAREAIRSARRELRLARTTGRVELTPEQKAEIEKKADAVAQTRKADRKKRADEHREAIKKEHGELVGRPDVRLELRRHAWRVARLEQVIVLGEAAGRAEAVTRAKELLTKEQEAHKLEIARLAKEKVEVPAKPAAAAIAAPAAKGVAPAPNPNKPTTGGTQ